ncbi:MAG: DUF4292 domain-containing protein [Chitinophagaceae bacterium]
MKYIIPFCFVVMIASCRSAKKINSSIPAADSALVIIKAVDSSSVDSAKIAAEFVQAIDSNKIMFSTFFGKIKLDFDDGDKKYNDLTAFVRIKKDSVIWISLNALLTEAFRVFITPDSVKVMDKLNKSIQIRDFNFLQEVTHLPVSFLEMQNLILGNPIFFYRDTLKYSMGEHLLQLVGLIGGFSNTSDFNHPSLILSRTRLKFMDSVQERNANLEYLNYEQFDGRRFSSRRKIMISDKKQVDLSLEFKQVVFDKPVNFPFSVPVDYKLK